MVQVTLGQSLDGQSQNICKKRFEEYHIGSEKGQSTMNKKADLKGTRAARKIAPVLTVYIL